MKTAVALQLVLVLCGVTAGRVSALSYALWLDAMQEWPRVHNVRQAPPWVDWDTDTLGASGSVWHVPSPLQQRHTTAALRRKELKELLYGGPAPWAPRLMEFVTDRRLSGLAGAGAEHLQLQPLWSTTLVLPELQRGAEQLEEALWDWGDFAEGTEEGLQEHTRQLQRRFQSFLYPTPTFNTWMHHTRRRRPVGLRAPAYARWQVQLAALYETLWEICRNATSDGRGATVAWEPLAGGIPVRHGVAYVRVSVYDRAPPVRLQRLPSSGVEELLMSSVAPYGVTPAIARLLTANRLDGGAYDDRHPDDSVWFAGEEGRAKINDRYDALYQNLRRGLLSPLWWGVLTIAAVPEVLPASDTRHCIAPRALEAALLTTQCSYSYALHTLDRCIGQEQRIHSLYTGAWLWTGRLVQEDVRAALERWAQSGSPGLARGLGAAAGPVLGQTTALGPLTTGLMNRYASGTLPRHWQRSVVYHLQYAVPDQGCTQAAARCLLLPQTNALQTWRCVREQPGQSLTNFTAECSEVGLAGGPACRIPQALLPQGIVSTPYLDTRAQGLSLSQPAHGLVDPVSGALHCELGWTGADCATACGSLDGTAVRGGLGGPRGQGCAARPDATRALRQVPPTQRCVYRTSALQQAAAGGWPGCSGHGVCGIGARPDLCTCSDAWAAPYCAACGRGAWGPTCASSCWAMPPHNATHALRQAGNPFGLRGRFPGDLFDRRFLRAWDADASTGRYSLVESCAALPGVTPEWRRAVAVRCELHTASSAEEWLARALGCAVPSPVALAAPASEEAEAEGLLPLSQLCDLADSMNITLPREGGWLHAYHGLSPELQFPGICPPASAMQQLQDFMEPETFGLTARNGTYVPRFAGAEESLCPSATLAAFREAVLTPLGADNFTSLFTPEGTLRLPVQQYWNWGVAWQEEWTESAVRAWYAARNQSALPAELQRAQQARWYAAGSSPRPVPELAWLRLPVAVAASFLQLQELSQLCPSLCMSPAALWEGLAGPGRLWQDIGPAALHRAALYPSALGCTPGQAIGWLLRNTTAWGRCVQPRVRHAATGDLVSLPATSTWPGAGSTPRRPHHPLLDSVPVLLADRELPWWLSWRASATEAEFLQAAGASVAAVWGCPEQALAQNETQRARAAAFLRAAPHQQTHLCHPADWAAYNEAGLPDYETVPLPRPGEFVATWQTVELRSVWKGTLCGGPARARLLPLDASGPGVEDCDVEGATRCACAPASGCTCAEGSGLDPARNCVACLPGHVWQAGSGLTRCVPLRACAAPGGLLCSGHGSCWAQDSTRSRWVAWNATTLVQAAAAFQQHLSAIVRVGCACASGFGGTRCGSTLQALLQPPRDCVARAPRFSLPPGPAPPSDEQQQQLCAAARSLVSAGRIAEAESQLQQTGLLARLLGAGDAERLTEAAWAATLTDQGTSFCASRLYAAQRPLTARYYSQVNATEVATLFRERHAALQTCLGTAVYRWYPSRPWLSAYEGMPVHALLPLAIEDAEAPARVVVRFTNGRQTGFLAEGEEGLPLQTYDPVYLTVGGLAVPHVLVLPPLCEVRGCERE